MDEKPGPDPKNLIDVIMLCSKKLFADKGYNGTSMRDIARAAECSQSMISHHFGSKAQLWNRVKEESICAYMQQVCDAELMVGNKNFKSELCGFIDQRIAHFEKEPDIVRMITWSALEGLEDKKPPKVKKLMQKFVSSLRLAQDNGEVRDDIEPEIMAFFVLFSTRAWFQDRKCWVLKALGKDHKEGLEDYTLALKKILKGGIFKA